MKKPEGPSDQRTGPKDEGLDTARLVHSFVRSTPAGKTLRLKTVKRGLAFAVDGRLSTRAELREGELLRAGSSRFTYAGGDLLRVDSASGFRIDAKDLSKSLDRKPILHHVSFSIVPGELVGLLGPSGSGKTTLIRLLAGLDNPSSGSLTMDGMSVSAYKGLLATQIGFVPQEDVLRPEFTPREILRNACRLRLSRAVGKDEMASHVTRLLQLLDLEDAADRRVGHLSGGQRKRVNIGMEMAAQPGILLLDEPNSNLDPGLEANTMQILRRIANGKRTVLLATHRLNQIFMLDQVGVLCQGQLAYFGPPEKLLPFFDCTDTVGLYQKLEQHPTVEWAERFRNSEVYASGLKKRLTEGEQVPTLRPSRRSIGLTLKPASPPAQLGVLSLRYMRSHLRDKAHLGILLGQAPVIATLIWLVFGRTGAVWPMLFCMCLSCIWFGAINAVKEICKERPLWIREKRSGLKATPYLASKYLVISLICLVQVCILVGLMHLLVPLEGNLILHALNFYLVSLCAVALGLLISAASAKTDWALEILPLILIPQVLFSGAIVAFDEMFAASQWISGFMPSRWSFAAAKKIALTFGWPREEWVALLGFTSGFILLALAVLSGMHKLRRRTKA